MKKKDKINRRKFMKLTVMGAATTGLAAIMVYSERFLSETPVVFSEDIKNTFAKCGACSHTLFYLLNREFGHPKVIMERASDPLAGGLMMKQQQCGMLWGATLATGAESYRRNNNSDQAVAAAITGAQYLVQSFSARAKTVNCLEIVNADITSSFDVAKLMLKSLPSGFKNMVCMNLAEKWAPEAVQSAKKGLSDKSTKMTQQPMCCACEVAKKMGAGDEETVMVAGFSGGLGLSGHACGALSAAIWLNTLTWCSKNPGESGSLNPTSKEILNTFFSATGSEMLCHKITGRRFNTLEEHSDFVQNGGCAGLIDKLTANFKMT